MKRTTALKLFTLLLSTSVLGAPVYGQEPVCPTVVQQNPCAVENTGPVTLQETLERTYMQNATLDAARAGLRFTVEDVSQAVADWRPSLSARGTKSFEWDRNLLNHTKTRFTDNNYTAQIAQNIYKGGETIATIGQKDNTFFAQKGGLFAQEQTTLFQAVQAHVGVLSTQDIVKYRQEAVGFFKTVLDDAEARFDVGAAARTDVEAARSQYEGALGNLSKAIGDFESAKATYVQVVASPPDNLAPADVILPLPTSYEEAYEVASTNNPSIKQARFTVEAAKYLIDVQFAGLLPVLNVAATASGDRRIGSSTPPASDPDQKQTSYTVQATLDVPIYAQGIPSSQVRQAYQQLAQNKVQLVQTRRDVEQATKDAWAQHIAARDALKGFLAAVKSGEVAVEGAKLQYEVGAISIVDVLTLQNDLITAQISLVGAQAAVINTSYGVLQAMGSLMAANLKLNVQYYDADAYYEEYRDAWIEFWQTKDWRYVRDEPCGNVCTQP